MLSFLLAAGHGKRAGGPKAWQLRDGRTLLERQLDFLVPRFGAPRVFVSVQEPWLDRCRALSGGVSWVAVDAEAAPFAALQALIAASGAREAAFLHHVDMPVWEPALFDALEAAARAAPEAAALVANYRGRRGHPVLLSAAAQRRLAAEPAEQRLDAWLRAAAPVDVSVTQPSALENWNFPPPRA